MLFSSEITKKKKLLSKGNNHVFLLNNGLKKLPDVAGLPLILSLAAGLRPANQAKRLAVRAKSLYNNVCPVERDVVLSELGDSTQVNIFNLVDQGEMAELVEGARLEIA